MSRAADSSTERFRVAGVVPAAGASTRMGAPKALLEHEGRTFLRWVVESLRAGGCDPVLVVLAAADAAARREAEAAGGIVLENPDPGEGPITSLRLAIRHLGTSVDAMAYQPVDHPAVRPETIASLVAAASREQALVIPVYGSKRGHPALFRASLFDELVDPTLEGGARTVVHRHLPSALMVQVDDPGVIADIDTPEQYARLVAGFISAEHTS